MSDLEDTVDTVEDGITALEIENEGKLSRKRGQKKLRLANRSEFSLGKSTIQLNYIGVFLSYQLENMIPLPYGIL